MDKKTLRKFDIRIQSLSNNKHKFSFDFNQELFDNYSKELDFFDSKGNCEIELIKTEMMLDFTFMIDGEVYLKCDRTLKKFKYEMNTSKKILFKFGDKDEEISDEMMVINRNKSIVNVSKFIYEFFLLNIPVKRLHPSLKNEDNIDNFVYKTNKTNKVDPRLDLLNNLK